MQIIIKRNHIIIAILSFMSVYALGGMLKVTSDLHTLSNSLLGLFVYIAAFYLFSKVNKLNIPKRLWIISNILGIIFSFWMVAGVNVLMFNTTNLNHLNVWFKVVCGVPMFAALIIFIFSVIPKINTVSFSKKVESKLNYFFSIKKNFLIIWLMIFLAWLPGLIASYPGIYAYDSAYQINSFMSGQINLQHPLVDTYLIGFCIIDLGKFLGSRELGMLVYSVFQMLILSFSFAMIIKYMTKKRVSGLIQSLFLLIFMFLPVNPIMAFSATKDVIYAATFVLVIIMLLRLADDQTLFFNKGYLLAFVVVAFINIIFRSQGIYVFLFGAVFGLIYFRKYWIRMLVLILLPLLLFVVYSGPVTKALNGVSNDDVSLHEKMSVPVVQLSRSLYYDTGELSQHEKEKIKSYIPNYMAIKDSPGIADAMKNTFNSSLFRKNPVTFVKLWVQVGIKKPLTYVNAFSRLTIGLWYPDVNYPDIQADHPYWEYSSWSQKRYAYGSFVLVKRQTPNFMKWLSDIYYRLSYNNSYQKLPVISMLFSSGFYTWSILIYIAWCLYKKRYRYLFPVSLVLGLGLTLLLGPVVLYRYVFPIALTLPVFFTDIITANSKNY